MTAEDIIDEMMNLNPEALVPTDMNGSRMYDSALIGYAERCSMPTVACYDREKCIEWLQTHNQWDRESALEFFDFNVAGAYIGENGPLFVTVMQVESVL